MHRRFGFTAGLAILPMLILLFVGLGCTRSDNRTTAHREPSKGATGIDALADGLYPVLWEATTPDSVTEMGSGKVVLPYDRKYTGSAEREPRTYLGIDTASFVPLILEGQPEAKQDGTGRSLLSVTLAREHVQHLEDFTTKHLGEPVAIILDGEVVTMHKIRSIIREGRLQITRCDDNSCEVLRAKLAN